MVEIWQGLTHTLGLIMAANSEVGAIVVLSLKVSGVALVVSTLVGVPLGSWLGLSHFWGRRLFIAFL
ncbi:MAG: tungstate transporter permease, partial [Dehalococcoidia bacterium]